jgi:hypothetical protein
MKEEMLEVRLPAPEWNNGQTDVEGQTLSQ